MLKEEFIERIGFYPSEAMYKAIENEYMTFDGDKDAFCKAYSENADGLAEKIAREVDKTDYRREEDFTKLETEYALLEDRLEQEQEWKLLEDTDNVSQEEYEKLEAAFGTEKMSDDRAKELLWNLFGFAKDRIKIYRTIDRLEVNRHGLLRKVGEIDRRPLYNSTDWNYIRFGCGCMSYELSNGELRFYVH